MTQPEIIAKLEKFRLVDKYSAFRELAYYYFFYSRSSGDHQQYIKYL
ncbi:MAG: hypothetical protein ACTHJ0_00305 [Flavipsychrobacter sp.]